MDSRFRENDERRVDQTFLNFFEQGTCESARIPLFAIPAESGTSNRVERDVDCT
jgi:hypothetical protein